MMLFKYEFNGDRSLLLGIVSLLLRLYIHPVPRSISLAKPMDNLGRIHWRRSAISANVLESLSTDTLQLLSGVLKVSSRVSELRFSSLSAILLLAKLGLKIMDSSLHLLLGLLDAFVLSHICEDIVEHHVAEEMSYVNEYVSHVGSSAQRMVL